MSLARKECCPMTCTPSMEHMMYHTFSDALRDFDRSINTVAPYWLHTPAIHECSIGNTVGKVVDDKEKFKVEMDVTQFRPDELKVYLREKELVVEGCHEERMDETGRVERRFVRKYMLPGDVNMDTLESHLSDKGILTLRAKKLAVESKHIRTIPITAAPRERRHHERKEEKIEKRL